MNQPRPPRSVNAPTTTAKPGVPHSQSAPSQGEIINRLDGQRGWLNELDSSLKKRSIIALVLTCLAIGAGAAAIYISLSKNSDSDRIDALETRIENLEAAAAGTGTSEGILPEDEGLVPGSGTTEPEAEVILPETVVPGETGGAEEATTAPVPPTP